MALVVLLVFVFPSRAGDPAKATEQTPLPEGAGTGPFWWVATALFVGFLLTIVLAVGRFVWRYRTGDTEPAAAEGNEWRMLPRKDADRRSRV